jgi:exodeoxyribonuclease-3
MLRIITLNLNGIRASVSKGLLDWLAAQKADVVCLQEVKAQLADIVPATLNPRPYSGHFSCAEKKGYSGVGLYCRQPPDKIIAGFGSKEFDPEGRYLRANYGKLSVISVYLPSRSSRMSASKRSSASCASSCRTWPS